METGEIKSLKILKRFLITAKFHRLLTLGIYCREQVDVANTRVVHRAASGQNGTLTPYPGQGFDKLG